MDIVVGYIRTPEGRVALDRAVAEAKLRGGRVIVVHSSRGGRGEDADEVVADREELERIEEEYRYSDVPVLVRELVRGNTPAEDLVAVAGEVGAELIVIGLRKRTPVGKFILGSNAQEILLSADCPVLAVKASG